MKLSNRATIGLALASSLSLFSSTSHSAAFGIAEQSALGIGNAFAGGAASAEDASTIWYNPAGMTRIKGNQLVIGTHLIFPSFDFDDKGSTRVGGGAAGGDGSSDGGRVAAVPNFYYVHSLSDTLKVGLGINAPFGLATKYDSDWAGRFQANESEIVTVNINPSIAWQVTPELSVGLGISAQYIEATLSNSLDFGIPTEGYSHLEADDWSAGINAGLLYDVNETTRIGFSYRSEVRHNLEGSGDLSTPLGDVRLNLDAQADLPASASLSIHHQWNKHVAVMADATWVGWSSIQSLIIEFDNGTTGTEITKLKDNIRLSIGATYTTEGPWTFRTGFAFDEGAARNAATRSSRFPDNDRYWLTFGASYQMTQDISFDAGYAHIFVPDTKINRPGGPGAALVGEYESDADILSAQIRWDM